MKTKMLVGGAVTAAALSLGAAMTAAAAPGPDPSEVNAPRTAMTVTSSGVAVPTQEGFAGLRSAKPSVTFTPSPGVGNLTGLTPVLVTAADVPGLTPPPAWLSHSFGPGGTLTVTADPASAPQQGAAQYWVSWRDSAGVEKAYTAWHVIWAK